MIRELEQEFWIDYIRDSFVKLLFVSIVFVCFFFMQKKDLNFNSVDDKNKVVNREFNWENDYQNNKIFSKYFLEHKVYSK